MDRVSDIIDPTLRRMGVRTRVREAQLQEALASLLGSSLAPMCKAIELKRGTLVVATAHTGLAHQLQLDSANLVDSLNASIGEPVIRRLRFTAM